MNNKHIGIITFCNTLDNYGQVLQYLATQDYLEARGHSVYLYQSFGHKVSLFNRVKRKIKKVIKKLIFSPPKSITRQYDSAISEQEQAKQVMFPKWAIAIISLFLYWLFRNYDFLPLRACLKYSIPFCLFFVSVGPIVNIQSKLLYFIGKNSLLFYLIHIALLLLLRESNICVSIIF